MSRSRAVAPDFQVNEVGAWVRLRSRAICPESWWGLEGAWYEYRPFAIRRCDGFHPFGGGAARHDTWYEIAPTGMGLLFTSSAIEETLGVCDRILVFYKGRIIREVARGTATKADVMHWITGEGDDEAQIA
jgi:hypothetical protein